MHKKIDLGRKVEDYENVPVPVKADSKGEKIIYPSLYMSHMDGMKGSDIPESGKAMIEFEKVGHNMRKDGDGEWDGSCEFDVKSITFMGGGKKEDKKDEMEETMNAMDDYFDKSKKGKDEEEESGEEY